MPFSSFAPTLGLLVAIALGSACHPTVPLASLDLDRSQGVFRLRGAPFSGTAESRRADGQIKEQVELHNGLRDGLRRRWFANGRLAFRATYRAGRLHGTSRTWWKDGTLRSLSTHRDGVGHGVQLRWYRSGALFKEMNLDRGRESGLQRGFRPNGKPFANYEARGGRVYGLKRSNLCFQLEKEKIRVQD